MFGLSGLFFVLALDDVAGNSPSGAAINLKQSSSIAPSPHYTTIHYASMTTRNEPKKKTHKQAVMTSSGDA